MRKVISIVMLAAFMASSVGESVFAQAISDSIFRLPVPGTMVHLSESFTPDYLKGIIVHPDNPFKFDFIVYKGNQTLPLKQKQAAYTQLVKYFLASLAVPEDDQWVNLSPYEKGRIIKEDFGKTEMGADLLSQDYILKQITASLISPMTKLGQEFWDKVYGQAQKEFGTTNIPINAFNKVWIVPDSAEIIEKGNMAYCTRNHLKVLLEEDYLSLKKHTAVLSGPSLRFKGENAEHQVASQILKKIILPQLEKEVNEGKNFALLRQIFSGVVLAAWYKRELKDSFLAKIYMNKSRLKGVDQNPKNNQIIYQQYLKAFKKGVFNFIKEDRIPFAVSSNGQNQTIARKYFSGGTVARYDRAALSIIPATDFQIKEIAKEFSNEDLATVAAIEAKSDAAMTVSPAIFRVRATYFDRIPGVDYRIHTLHRQRLAIYYLEGLLEKSLQSIMHYYQDDQTAQMISHFLQGLSGPLKIDEVLDNIEALITDTDSIEGFYKNANNRTFIYQLLQNLIDLKKQDSRRNPWDRSNETAHNFQAKADRLMGEVLSNMGQPTEGESIENMALEIVKEIGVSLARQAFAYAQRQNTRKSIIDRFISEYSPWNLFEFEGGLSQYTMPMRLQRAEQELEEALRVFIRNSGEMVSFQDIRKGMDFRLGRNDQGDYVLNIIAVGAAQRATIFQGSTGDFSKDEMRSYIELNATEIEGPEPKGIVIILPRPVGIRDTQWKDMKGILMGRLGRQYPGSNIMERQDSTVYELRLNVTHIPQSGPKGQPRLKQWAALILGRGAAKAPASGDRAQASHPGGIDMNSANVDIHRQGEGPSFSFRQQDKAQLSVIAGLEPILISIQPAGGSALFSQVFQSKS